MAFLGLDTYFNARAKRKKEAELTKTLADTVAATDAEYESKKREAAELSITNPEAAKQMIEEAAKAKDEAYKAAIIAHDEGMQNLSNGNQKSTDDTKNKNSSNDNSGNSNSPSNSNGSNNNNTANNNASNNGDSDSSFKSGVKSVVGGALAYGMAKGLTKDGDPAGTQEHLRNQARMHDKQAGDEQKNSQANMQVANRDYRVEAEKNAVSQAASENAQKVNNMGNASAGAAALERGVKSADYNTHMNRQDQQRAEGVKNQREMWGARQTAEQERGKADADAYNYQQNQMYNMASDALSKGKPAQQEPTPQEPTPQEPEPTPTPTPENTEDTEDTEEPVQEEEDEQEKALSVLENVNMQDVQNWLQGSRVRRGNSNEKTYAETNTMDPEIVQALSEYEGKEVKPLAETYTKPLDAEVAAAYPKLAELWGKSTGRGPLGVAGKQYNVKSDTEADEKGGGAAVTDELSDVRMKNIINTLRNFRFW